MNIFDEQNQLKDSFLGKKVDYSLSHDKNILFPISRLAQRHAIGINGENLPFFGFDIWNSYEISWLNNKGKPEIAIGRFIVPANSPFIVESKSLKLYLNSLNQKCFNSKEELAKIISEDLSFIVKAPVSVTIFMPHQWQSMTNKDIFLGDNIDNFDIECTEYNKVNKELLECNNNEIVTETLNTNIFKSNCPVTNQPDWASIIIKYHGPKINQISLLKYLVSYRNHQGFHEQIVEKIFCDLSSMNLFYLNVYALYSRRGGIDIFPYRSSAQDNPVFIRSPR